MEPNDGLLDRRIKKFTSSLRKDFAELITQNPATFRKRVIGRVRAGLPRGLPGRTGNPEVRKAAEIYQRDYLSQGKPGNWHLIALAVCADYPGLTSDLQRLRRISLRATVHSLRHEAKSRARRIATPRV